MSENLTRRQLAVGLIGAAQALAQAPTAAPPPDDATISRDRMKSNSDIIRRFDLPVATEPSAIFKP